MKPQSPDLRAFLESVRQNLPHQILTIKREVPLDYTATALALALEKQRRAPILFFERMTGQAYMTVANIFAARQILAWSVGAASGNFGARLGECLDHLIPAEHVAGGPVHEVVWEGDEVDLARLPIPIHFAQDAGRYITAGMVAARDPDTGIGNLAYARLQVKGPRRMGASIHSRQHLWDYQRRAEAAGKDLPVAVVLGGHPAIMVAAAAKMSIDEDEYDLAGALLGQPLPLCRARTVDVDVPANAEIVIEGRLLANVREDEGPFGEYTGYATARSTRHVLEVTAITLRRDAIFVDIIPGNSSEHLTLGGASKEAWVYKRMKEALPFVLDFHYPASGTHFHCVIRVKKTAEGQPQQAAQLLLGLDHYVKMVIVVDQDIDPTSDGEVGWALATRMQADRDVAIIPRTICNQLDPSSEGGVGAKMIIDATRRLDSTAQRVSVPESADVIVRQLLADAGFTADP